MISKYLLPGNKAELQLQWMTGQSHQNTLPLQDTDIMKSQLLDIASEDELLLLTPATSGMDYYLSIGTMLNVVFYTKTGLFQCSAKVIRHERQKNIPMIRVEIVSNLRKFQRREYYRFSCALEMAARELVEEERLTLEKAKAWVPSKDLPLKRSVIVDISGGGLRFMATQKYEPGSYIYCGYQLGAKGENKKYELVGEVLDVAEKEGTYKIYEHRVRFVNVPEAVRDEIIKIIFEMERQNRSLSSKK
ncbi:MAG: flagellar brake protein [Lachnospiraceae bacterium]|jgi:c-di-GMP-binding flagellar brake protein YcgR|nr:flagellar brake protein [Lachnospiraceae bacterium]